MVNTVPVDETFPLDFYFQLSKKIAVLLYLDALIVVKFTELRPGSKMAHTYCRKFSKKFTSNMMRLLPGG